MKKSLKITPYDEHWIDCVANDSVSIATTIEPSYRNLAILNSYQYKIEGSTSWWRTLSIDVDEQIYRLFKANVIDAAKEDITIEYVKNKIDEGRYIKYKTDLYDLLPSNIFYHKQHFDHYQLMTGYDDEKRVLYMLCDDANGYGEREISYDSFYEKFILDDEYSVVECDVNADMPAYKYQITEVIKNAQKTLQSIKVVSYLNLWIGNEESCYTPFVLQINKLADRQKANALLFKLLTEDKYITVSFCNDLSAKTMEIYNDWSFIKNCLIKSDIKNDKIDFNKLNILSKIALQKEYELWSLFLQNASTEKSPKPKKLYKKDSNDIEFEYLPNQNDPWNTIINVKSMNTQGRLICEKEVNGFSVIFEEKERLKNAEIVDDCVRLYTNIPYYNINDFSEAFVNYSQINNVKIHDKMNDVIPEFENKPIENRYLSPYLNIIDVSEPLEFEHNIEDLQYEHVSKSSFKQVSFLNNICWINEIYDSELIIDKIAFYKFNILCDNITNLKLHLGYYGPIKVWVNYIEALTVNSKESPLSVNDSIVKCNVPKGESEVVIGFKITSSEYRQSGVGNLGISIKIEPDEENLLPFIVR